ncbi:hypothetical protein FDH86_gp076 [Arthrobacter phage Tank]|uniref:Uncharacterized protein n=1 Tax=Arthrobacter phage Tank TaxID=1772319 RepID=A0A0U4KBE8_9CAUD|nr:hypothetical protein FDH86_gp076 [Arthrobacter phage Tank]ALY10611.1 hypothetical protein TANK_76 [Arthrobacter phage Tank]
MISQSDRIYYVDPVVDHVHSMGSTEVLVLMDEPGYNPIAGEICNIYAMYHKDGAIKYSSRGREVEGIPLSPTNPRLHDTYMLGFLTDDLFVLGEPETTTLNGRVCLSNPMRSDGGTWPADMDSIEVRRWCQAAPWALQLWPVPGETQAVTDAKVRVAKAHWRRRYLEALVYRTVAECDMWDELDQLVEKGHSLGEVIFNHHLAVDVLLPTQAAPSDEELSTWGVKGQHVGMKLAILTSLIMDTCANRSEVNPVTRHSVMEHVRTLHGSRATVGDYTVSPVVRRITPRSEYEG